MSNRGDTEQAADFVEWFASLDYRLKLFISGNHDFDLNTGKCIITNKLANGDPYPENMIHLVDQQIDIGGVKIWGAATEPKKELASKQTVDQWASIPNDTDILITHYPPRDILDRNLEKVHCGLRWLRIGSQN